jgi:hypothetical protein
MRNGLLVYKSYSNTFNIGDYIQSIAALQFIDGEVIYVNRERLDEYTGDPLRLSMNGWFLHELSHWPPSDKIHPLFVSFHLNSNAIKILENVSTIEYLKMHQPIGCRDKTTMEKLIQKGVDAYFSGCLTLTLGEKYKHQDRSNLIYFVDPYYDTKNDFCSIAKYIFVLLTNFNNIFKICKSMFNEISVKSIFKTTAFYSIYEKIFETKVLVSAIYIKHYLRETDFPNETRKFKFGEDLLSKYSSAKYIVTSRIHCALPCLGLDTPVLFVENTNQSLTSSCRLDGLLNLFHVIKYNKGRIELPFLNNGLKKMRIDTMFKNKHDHLVLKDKLIIKCKNYFNS